MWTFSLTLVPNVAGGNLMTDTLLAGIRTHYRDLVSKDRTEMKRVRAKYAGRDHDIERDGRRLFEVSLFSHSYPHTIEKCFARLPTYFDLRKVVFHADDWTLPGLVPSTMAMDTDISFDPTFPWTRVFSYRGIDYKVMSGGDVEDGVRIQVNISPVAFLCVHQKGFWLVTDAIRRENRATKAATALINAFEEGNRKKITRAKSQLFRMIKESTFVTTD